MHKFSMNTHPRMLMQTHPHMPMKAQKYKSH